MMGAANLSVDRNAEYVDELLFAALAREAAMRVREFKAQNIANTAWAFVTVGPE